MISRKKILMADTTVLFAPFFPSAWSSMSLSLMQYVERCIGVPGLLLHGCILEDFASSDVDAGFLDVASYFQLLRQKPCPVELVALSIASDGREHDIRSTFFDVVVQTESSLVGPNDVEGCVWVSSPRGISPSDDYFRSVSDLPMLNVAKTIEVASQAQALRYLLEGKADATALDSRTFDLVLRNSPRMAGRLRLLGTYCISTSLLVVVAAHLSASLKQKIGETFSTIHQEPFFAQWFLENAIEQFLPATNTLYRDECLWYERSGRVLSSFPLRSPIGEAYVSAHQTVR